MFKRLFSIFTILSILLSFASYIPFTKAVGEASTRFHIYVPPNNISGRSVSLIVTAQDDGTTVDIVDENEDGDNDDTYTNISLDRGDSYVVYIKEGTVNDDARGKWDGDYFTVTSTKPTTVQMSTDSDWQHDWAPADNKTMKGQNFYLFSPPTSYSDRDINVYAYENDTDITIYDITTTKKTNTGKATVDFDNATKILAATLSEGEDLIVRNNLGVDLLDPGHSYYVQSTKPVTVQYGALYDKRRNSARDGGGFIPSFNGSSSGEKFYFFIPHNPNKKSEMELRLVSFDDSNSVTLDGWDADNEQWVEAQTWTLDNLEHGDYVGGNYELFRLNGTSGKKLAAFEANWLETGLSGTSDIASFLSAKSGYGAGKEFLAYLGPPGYQTNIKGQKGKYSHLFLFGHYDNTSITVKDADTNGTIINKSYTLNDGDYIDVKISQAEYNQMNKPGEGKRPYLHVTSDDYIAVLDTNWNDNWMTYATSVLAPTPQTTITASVPEVNVNGSFSATLNVKNTGDANFTSPTTTVTIPDGIDYVSSSGDLGLAGSSTSNGITTLTFSGFTFNSGADLDQTINLQLSDTYNDSSSIENGDMFSVRTLTQGTYQSETLMASDSASVRAKDTSKIDVASFAAIKKQTNVTVSWNTAFENNNQGFNVYRSTKADGRYRKVNSSIIASQGDSPTGNPYSYSERVGNPRVDYFYKLQVVPTLGDPIWYGPVSTKDSANNNIAIVTPNTKRVFTAGEKVFLAWSTVGTISNVKIEYSKDNFVSDVNTVVASTPNSTSGVYHTPAGGNYRWTVPTDYSSTVKFRVSDAADSSVKDISDENSIIRQAEYSNPSMEVYTTSLKSIPKGTPKYFPFGVADYTELGCNYDLTASTDQSNWTLSIYEDADKDGVVDELESIVSSTGTLKKSDDEKRYIIKADISSTGLDSYYDTIDSRDYKLTLKAACALQNKEDEASYIKHEAENLSTEGKIVEDTAASGNKAVYGAIPNVLHHLTYGGYFTEQIGNNKFYAVVFKAKSDSNDLLIPVGEIDIWDDHAKNTIAEYFFPGNQFIKKNQYQSLFLYFLSPLSGVLEHRVDFYGKANMWVDTVEVREVRKGANITYEAELMDKFAGQINTNATASNGQEVKTVAGQTGYISFGPYSTLPNDTEKYYQADFYLKTDDKTVANKLGRIEIYNFLGANMVAQADIYGTQFFENDTYQKFSLTWKGLPLDQANSGFFGTSMEYRVYSYGNENATLYLDKIVQHHSANQSEVYEAELQDRQIGAIYADKNASNLSLVKSDQSGFLQFGPYSTDEVNVTDGIFDANFALTIDDNTKTAAAGEIDVFNSSTGQKLGSIRLYPTQFRENNKIQNFIIRFKSPPTGELEYRVKSFGTSTLGLDKVEVRQIDETDALEDTEENEVFSYEDKDLLTVGSGTYDPLAGDFQASVLTNTAGHVTFGPYTTDGIGTGKSYKARFRVKTNDKSSSSPIAKIDVYHPQTNSVLTERDISGNQFISANSYQEFDVTFSAPASGTLEYRTYSYGTTEISLDRIKIFEAGASVANDEVDPDGHVKKFSYEAESLFNFAGDRMYDEKVSGYRTIKSAKNNGGFMVFGPYTKDGVGTSKNYKAKFKMAVSDITESNVAATIDVLNDGVLLSQVDIFPNQFPGNNEYAEIPLNFASPSDGRLEYRLYSHGSTDVFCDYIDVYEITSSQESSTSTDNRFEAESMDRNVGNIVYDEDASHKRAVRSSANGKMNFGPYTTALSGTSKRYDAKFYLKINDNSGGGSAAKISVYSNNKLVESNRIFASQFTANDTYYPFTVTFESPAASEQVEFRVQSYGNKTLHLDRVDVDENTDSLSSTSYDYRYEAELLPSLAGTASYDANASNSQTISVANGESGWVAFGPYTSDAIGSSKKYNAKFYLSTSDKTNSSKLLYIDVANNGSRITHRKIFGSEFSADDTYENFDLSFSAPDTGTLEYRIYAYGNGDVKVDRIDLVEDTSSSSSSPGTLLHTHESEDMYRGTGATVYDGNAQNVQAAEAGSGETGFLSFGPYVNNTAGTGLDYDAKFYLKVNNNSTNSPAARVDVYANGSVVKREILFPAQFSAANTYEAKTIRFASPASGPVEYRVYSYGNVDLSFDRVEIHSTSGGGGGGGATFAYEGENMYRSVGSLSFDSDASGSKAAKALVGQSGHLNFGPYTAEGVGTNKQYQAKFNLKVADNNPDSEVVIVDVAKNGEKLAELRINANDFTSADTYQEFTLDFTSPSNGLLEYRAYVTGQGIVSLDKVDVFEQ